LGITPAVTAPKLASETFIPRVGLSHAWMALRIVMGWSFIWVFADVIFGLGFPTVVGWIYGGDPTDTVMSFY
jgi:thiosulfate dehydrogenase [quinone] large subunit